MNEPVEATILAIDPAKHTSGAVILSPNYGGSLSEEEEHPFDGSYDLVEFGKVESQAERERFVEAFLEAAMERGLPLVAVAEEWDPPRNKKLRLPGNQAGLLMDPKWTYQTVLGIGEGWGRWAAELETASAFLQEEEKRPAIPIIRVKPNNWRDDLWGRNRAKERRALKVTACRHFEGVFGYKASEDISEAGCIGLWASTSPRVHGIVETWMADSRKMAS